MTLIRYSSPWPAQVLQNELKHTFGHFLENREADSAATVTAQWVPAVDITEEAGRFVIRADLPGIEPEQIDVQMDKGILSIKGERGSETITEGESYSRNERRFGSFHRRFALPDSADADGISAHGRNGVLEILIPKKAQSAPRRIQVGNAGSVQ